MADQFGLQSDAVGAVVRGLAELGAQLHGQVASARAVLAGAGDPWGGDATGDQFAHVAQGFVAHMEGGFEAMAAHAQKLQGHARRLATATGIFVVVDQG